MYSAPAHMQTEKVVLVSTSLLVTCFLKCPYHRGGTASAAINCVRFALPPPTTGNLDRIATSNDLHVNVAQRKVIIRCYVQTAKLTPSFQLPVLLIKIVTRVENPRRVVNPRKNPLRAPSSLLCLKFLMLVMMITVIIPHAERKALT